MLTEQASKVDLPEILKLQYQAYQSEAKLLNSYDIPPLRQTLSDLETEMAEGLIFLKVLAPDGAVIGSVRGRIEAGTLYVGKLIVRPDMQGQGIGTKLLAEIERVCPHERCELFTSSRSEKNIRLYQRAGYHIYKRQEVSEQLEFVYLEKSQKHGNADT